MKLLSFTDEVVAAVHKELEVDSNRVKDSVKKLREWLVMQPHLPQSIEDCRLERMFIQCKCRMEITKSVIDMYFTLRTKIPEVLSNRDPFEPWFKEVTDKVYAITLPDYTEDFCRVHVMGVLNPPLDINSFDVYKIMKLAFMVMDIRYAEDFYVSDILIIDVNKATPAQASKFTLPVFKKLKLCALKAYKARVKSVHLVNAVPFMETVINIGKTIVNPKHRDRLILHSTGSGYSNLHEHISPKVLPKDFDGHGSSISELWEEWKKKICSYREWFINEGALTVDESKRPGKAIDTGELFGFEGSFTKLSVD